MFDAPHEILSAYDLARSMRQLRRDVRALKDAVEKLVAERDGLRCQVDVLRRQNVELLGILSAFTEDVPDVPPAFDGEP